MLNKKILSIICVVLLVAICGIVYANVLSLKTSTGNKIISQNLQDIVNVHCEKVTDINATFIDSDGNECIAEFGNVNVKMQPSSLFKYITLGIALNENLIEGDDVYECVGKATLSDANFRCYEKKGHGKVSFAKGISQSCPISYIEIANKIDNITFYNYIDKLGIDISSYYNKDNFNDKDKIAIAMGQGIKISPQELLLAYNKMIDGTDVITSESAKKLLECMKESYVVDSTIIFDGVCSNDLEHISAVLAITKKDEKYVLGIAFSTEINKKELSNTVQEILKAFEE